MPNSPFATIDFVSGNQRAAAGVQGRLVHKIHVELSNIFGREAHAKHGVSELQQDLSLLSGMRWPPGSTSCGWMWQHLEFDGGEQSGGSPGSHCINQALQFEAAQVEGLHARLHGLQEAPIDLCQHIRRSVLVSHTGLHALLTQVLSQILNLSHATQFCQEMPAVKHRNRMCIWCFTTMSADTGSQFQMCICLE